MANFIINIIANTLSTYSVNTLPSIDDVDSCIPVTLSVPYGLISSSPNSGITQYILKSWGATSAWATLNISNLSYSDEANFWIEHNGSDISTGSSNYHIDVTGILADAAIPNFLIKSSASFTPSKDEYIYFDANVIDVNGLTRGSEKITLKLAYNECFLEPDPIDSLTHQITSIDACSTQYSLSVFVPSGESRYVQITSMDGFGAGDITEIITASKTYSVQISGNTAPTQNTISNVEVTIKENDSLGDIVDMAFLKRRHSGVTC